ncbi:hypothetical protein CONLIGDRAFT_56785 [Coniochaeta ligniaria NRRL 30616]|uniref:Uncharacterized protein n=1 Tax=Coniochaeta ligniaria NRRL 30616 TaxID=1408157 RepID=A0A1J7K591_9PEZI|nr:hypothetical protein CONLIGDRAFT_56785 [Coniochaeta ligniaria NRRL 30616]
MGRYSVSYVIRHLVTTITLLCSHAWAQSSGNRTKPSDFFWQLQHLEEFAPTGNPYIGGQNFTYCCLKAVNQSLDVDSRGNLVLLNDWIVLPDGNATHLLDADSRGQFPCGATYNGDPNGAPVVQVNYTWLADECPGWERSGERNLNAWLQPLSGFLLPAIIFCLSVPRRRKLYIFRAFFVADLAGVKSYVPALLGAIGALVLVTLDTIIWLSTCFAFAGPMILSGLYEALLDNRILEFLRVKIHNQRLTLDMRCRCLMIILIGNLDLALDEPQDDHSATSLPVELTAFLTGDSLDVADSHELEHYGPEVSDGRSSGLAGRYIDTSGFREASGPPRNPTRPLLNQEQADTARLGRISQASHGSPSIDRSLTGTADIRQEFTPIQRQGTKHLRASPWRHMEELLYGIRLFDDEDQGRKLSPRQWPKHVCDMGPHCRVRDHVERPCPRTGKTERQVRKTKTRLRTMLHCQYSFGSIVGAPVIFFLGGFIFALLQSLEGLGDEDIAEDLAFGQWYMTIPHIAIVSGLLLAGNNPNILEGVFATERDETSDDFRFLGLQFELAYPSCYKVAWQWLRGNTKKKWINKLIETYETRWDIDFAGNRDRDSDIEYLRAMTTLSPLDWFLVLSLATLLLGVPFILAFLTAFFTPEIGLSCRSLTFTVYACLEFSQVLLWLWAYAGPPPPRSNSSKHVLNFLHRNGWLDRHGFYNPTSTSWLLGPRKHRTFRHVWSKTRQQPVRAFWCFVWYFLTTVFGLSAIFTALGGTLMQLMGVYSAGLCYVTVENWTRPYDKRPMPVISSNSRDMIMYASVYWKPCAITAIVFMTVVSFVGWWYQRRMRDMFATCTFTYSLPMFLIVTGHAKDLHCQYPLLNQCL